MVTLKKISILFTLCFSSTIIFSQTKYKLGVGIESIYSSSYYINGLTPSLIIDVSKHQVKIGPRITYQRLFGNSSTSSPKLIIDFAYHYNFYSKEKIKVFGQFRLEYAYTKYSHQWYYNPFEPSPVVGVYLGKDPIDAQLDYTGHNTNVYLGIGSEIKLYTNLFIFGNINYGIHISTQQSIYSNLVTHDIIQENLRNFSYQKRGMFASIGIKYQFSNN
jgi:hypothetical protein